jgi:hypothetical protein
MADNRISPKIDRESLLGKYLRNQSNNGKTYLEALEKLLPVDRKEHLIDLFEKFRGQVKVFYPDTDERMEALYFIFVSCVVHQKQISEETIHNLFLNLTAYSGGDN